VGLRYARVKTTDWRASESRLGVSPRSDPRNPMRSARVVSIVISTTFGGTVEDEAVEDGVECGGLACDEVALGGVACSLAEPWPEEAWPDEPCSGGARTDDVKTNEALCSVAWWARLRSNLRFACSSANRHVHQ